MHTSTCHIKNHTAWQYSHSRDKHCYLCTINHWSSKLPIALCAYFTETYTYLRMQLLHVNKEQSYFKHNHTYSSWDVILQYVGYICDPILTFSAHWSKWLLQLNMFAILWTMCENLRVIGPSVEEIRQFYYSIHYKLTFDCWSRCAVVCSPYTFCKQSKSKNRDKSPFQEVKD